MSSDFVIRFSPKNGPPNGNSYEYVGAIKTDTVLLKFADNFEENETLRLARSVFAEHDAQDIRNFSKSRVDFHRR